MKRSALPLSVERLEARDVPAVFGIPWLDGMHVTLSFAPDGTVISGTPSNLSSVLGSGNAAKLEILRAFQSWAANANVNIGLVADGGQDFTIGGAIQGDDRFGDIRIGARPIAGNELAITAPFNLFGSYSGNVVLNSAANVNAGATGGARDLYTVLLQEAGHTLGIDNSPDINSAMYEVYQGTRAGLSDGDIASIQSLYGARQADAYEGAAGNDTLATATRGQLTSVVEADLTTTSDVDCYRFSVPGLSMGARVRLQATGLSLVNAKVEVLNSAGRVVASSTASDPLHNDVAVDFSPSLLGGTYYVRVSSARSDSFGVGSYRIAVGAPTLVDALLSPVRLLSTELGLNDTLSAATGLLQSDPRPSNRIDYITRASLVGPNDVDYYRIHSPAAGMAATEYLVATVWGLGSYQLQPRLAVYDAAGNPVAARVLTNDGGSYTIQVDHAAANADYFVRVSSDAHRTGNYAVAMDFRTQAVVLDDVAAGGLTADAPQSAPLYLAARSQQFHFVLTAGPAASGSGAGVVMEICDLGNHVVFSLSADAGDTVSDDVFLGTGLYTIRFRSRSAPGSTAAPITYSLALAGLTDPVLSSCDSTVAPSGTSTSSSSPSGTSNSTSSSGSPYTCSYSPPPNGSTWY